MNAELCTMCMITAPDGRVLVQDRLPKLSNPWCGLTFPGGHVEEGESVVESVIREVQEETGLTIKDVRSAGYIQWYNPDDQSQYIVFLFKANQFTGDVRDSPEGAMKWMTLTEMCSGNLAPNMKKYLEIFAQEDAPYAYGVKGQDLSVIRV